MPLPPPNWHTQCTSHAGLLANLSSDQGMILAIILFLTVPSLTLTVLACLPARTKQALKFSPLARPRSKAPTPSRTQGSLGLKHRLFVATVFLLLSIAALALLGVAMQVWNFCGDKQMGQQLYVFMWVLYGLVPGVTVALACGAWGFLLRLVLWPRPTVYTSRIKIGSAPTRYTRRTTGDTGAWWTGMV